MSLGMPEIGVCQECSLEIEKADLEWVDREDGSMVVLCTFCREGEA